MISANATLQPVTAERLGEWGGGKAYSASELLKVAVSASCSLEGNVEPSESRRGPSVELLFPLDMNGFTGSRKGET